jgi:hypothetical protein
MSSIFEDKFYQRSWILMKLRCSSTIKAMHWQKVMNLAFILCSSAKKEWISELSWRDRLQKDEGEADVFEIGIQFSFVEERCLVSGRRVKC